MLYYIALAKIMDYLHFHYTEHTCLSLENTKLILACLAADRHCVIFTLCT